MPLGKKKEGQAKFWIIKNGCAVKLKMKRGDKLTYNVYRGTEEGYQDIEETWEHFGDFIRRTYNHYERDCDGPYEHHVEGFCHIDKLRFHPDVDIIKQVLDDRKDWDNSYTISYEIRKAITSCEIWFPEWETENERQRDHYAEAAGY